MNNCTQVCNNCIYRATKNLLLSPHFILLHHFLGACVSVKWGGVGQISLTFSLQKNFLGGGCVQGEKGSKSRIKGEIVNFHIKYDFFLSLLSIFCLFLEYKLYWSVTWAISVSSFRALFQDQNYKRKLLLERDTSCFRSFKTLRLPQRKEKCGSLSQRGWMVTKIAILHELMVSNFPKLWCTFGREKKSWERDRKWNQAEFLSLRRKWLSK